MTQRWRFFSYAALLLATGGLGTVACGRTGMLEDGQNVSSNQPNTGGDGGTGGDASTLPEDDPPDDVPPDPPQGGSGGEGGGGTPCLPTGERCNGVDDDCDGEVDEVPAVPCPGGGFRYCVAGAMSECPRRCEVCMPGSERVCFISYCTYWGVQTCASDGRSFSFCRERSAPWVCEDVVDEYQLSAQLEQCCLDNGYCCVDQFDLDGDGDTGEMLGNCEDLLCGG